MLTGALLMASSHSEGAQRANAVIAQDTRLPFADYARHLPGRDLGQAADMGGERDVQLGGAEAGVSG